MAGILDALVNPPRVTRSLDFSVLDDDLTRTIRRGAVAEQADEAEADEAQACHQLGELLEAEYEPWIALKTQPKPETLRVYTISIKQFLKFCDETKFARFETRDGFQRHPAKPVIVAAWLDQELKAGAKGAMIRRHVAALSWLHRSSGLADPCQSDLVRGVQLAANKGRLPPSPEDH
jgi:hypothetical protein